jgi:hypothetical protein
MSVKIVQTINKLSPTSSVSVATTGIALRSGQIRVSTAATAAYIDIGVNPVATSSSFQIPASSWQVFKERVARIGIVGVTTGATTILSFNEGIGVNPFTTDDYVTIENAFPVGLNTSHNQVLAVSQTSITINYNSSSITGIALTIATAARSVKIAALGQNGGADVSITEVQIAGQVL